MVDKYDRRFLRGLTGVKCWKLVIVSTFFGRTHKVAPGVEDKLKMLMKVRDDDGEYMALPDVKNPVRMIYERGNTDWYYASSREVV